MNLIRLYHTVKYLKLVQVTQRLLRKFRTLSLHRGLIAKRREVEGRWENQLLAPQSFFEDDKAIFLNQQGSISRWENQQQSTLWLYNLHYFDDLNAIGCETRRDMQQKIIKNWIDSNPPLTGNGWAPYASSLRVVNWIKALLSGLENSPDLEQSLFQQAYVLSQDVEYHLLGNHLFTNGKSLVFCGLYFEGEQAKKWLSQGLSILDKEIPEQILADGGNFELSTMYHNIILVDMLDLIQLATLYHHPLLSERVEQWRAIAAKMRYWMKTMLHPDGDIAFFNDAAMGIAHLPKDIDAYAEHLNIDSIAKNKNTLTTFEHSGYSVIAQQDYKIIFDHGNIGPDYLPGHAHADSLSFECSYHQQRIFVNTGTSLYGVSPARHRQRQTASHNTVVVDGHDSSEVWSGFRVARRAKAKLLKAVHTDNQSVVQASHNGYMRLPGKVTHLRSITAMADSFCIEDQIEGRFNECVAYFYLHPNVKSVLASDHSVMLTLPDQSKVRIEFDSTEVSINPSTWHPRFGQSLENSHIKVKFSKASLRTQVHFVDKSTSGKAS